MQRIEEIIKNGSEQIKEILLEETKKFKEFPKMLIGLRNPKYASKEANISEDNVFSVNTSSRGIAVPMNGILVYSNNAFWTERNYIIMLPQGLQRFRASMFVETENGKTTDYIKSFPDWESKIEIPEDYFVYSREAFCKIKKLLEKQEVPVC